MIDCRFYNDFFPLLLIIFLIGACSSRTEEIPELSRDVIIALEGSVPVRDLLELSDDQVMCLLGPYDEDFLKFGSYSLPEGFSVEALKPLLPIHEDEFVLALVGPKSTAANRYSRNRALDLMHSAQTAREEPRTVCASTSTAIILVQRRAGQAQIALTKER